MTNCITKKVLLSNIGIPSKKIGSWNIMITNLIEFDPTIFDYIVSPKPDFHVKKISNLEVKKTTFLDRLKKKYINSLYKRINFWRVLREIIIKEQRCQVHVIDDFSMVKAVHYFASREGLRNKLEILFYFHGFCFNYEHLIVNNVFSIDKLILLTDSSYRKMLSISKELPFEIEILNNGVKSDIFFPVNEERKKSLRKKLLLKPSSKYFLWVSQDRPKKGLKIILKAWTQLIKKNKEIYLIVIGTHHEIKGEKIIWFGRKSNRELNTFYQISDYYLFTTLWQEGFGLSLVEALKSGSKCIASNIGPISEVLDDGNLGFLVDKPHVVKSWVDSITYVLNNNYNFNKKNIDLEKIYDFNTWVKKFRRISSISPIS